MFFKKIGLILLICGFCISTANAKLIEPTALLNKVLESYKKVYQVNLLAEVKIYDPTAYLPLEVPTEEKLQPYELPGKSFNQNTIFVRDEFYAVENLDFEKKLLNIYFSQYHQETSYNFNEERALHTEDIKFPHLIFFTKHLSQLKKSLYAYGISPTEVSTYQNQYNYLYRLGNETGNILVDPNSFKVVELNTTIQYNGRYFPVRITFSKWDKVKKRVPLLTSFYIKNRLFKEINVHRILYRGNYTKKRAFYTKYKAYLTDAPVFPKQMNFAF